MSTVYVDKLQQIKSQENPSGAVILHAHYILPASGALVLDSEGFVEADVAERVAAGRHHRLLGRRKTLQGLHADRALRRLETTGC